MTADAGLVAHMLAAPAETTLGRALGHPHLLGRYRAVVGAPDRPTVAVAGDQVILGELGAGLPASPARPEAMVARALRCGMHVTWENAEMPGLAEVLAFQRARGTAIVGVLRENPDLLPLSTAGSWFFGSWRVRLIRRALLPVPPRALAWLGVTGTRLAIDVAFWQGVKAAATRDEWARYTLDSYVALCYHRLAGEYRPGEERIDVAPRIFARHLRILRMLRLRPVSAEALRSFHDLAGLRRLGSHRRVVVTADDGFADCVDVLRAHSAELRDAQVFVPTAAVGGRAWWVHGEPLAAWDELHALADSGVTVGSHGRQHRPFTELGEGDLTAELAGSAADLRQLGPAVPVLAYPNGAHDLRVRAAAQAAGYALAFTTAPGRNGAGTDGWCLRRITPKAWDSRLSFVFKVLTGEPLPWRWEMWRVQCFGWRRRAAAALRSGQKVETPIRASPSDAPGIRSSSERLTTLDPSGRAPYSAPVAVRWPNLFVVGVGKGGTSSLCAYLGQHNDVFMSPVKEPHFFSDADPDLVPAVKGEDAYLRLFEAATDERYRGEGSISYFWDPGSAVAIRRASPDARIIVSLRDPIARAHSHYWDTVRYGREQRSFREAVEDELAGRLPPGREPYLRRSLYTGPLQRFIGEFGANVHVLFFEELTRDSRAVLRRVFEFLAIDPSAAARIDLEARNPFAVPRSRTAQRVMSSARARKLARLFVPGPLRGSFEGLLLRREDKPDIDADLIPVLTDHFAGDRRALEDLLGRPAPWSGQAQLLGRLADLA